MVAAENRRNDQTQFVLPPLLHNLDAHHELLVQSNIPFDNLRKRRLLVNNCFTAVNVPAIYPHMSSPFACDH